MLKNSANRCINLDLMRCLCAIALLLGLAVPVVGQEAVKSITPSSKEALWPDREKLEHFLRKAKITEREKIGKGITNPEKVTLEMDGIVMNAIYKKVDKKHDSWRNEVAAYELDKLLGLGMVPPTVKRSTRGRKGCLQLWVTGTVMNEYEETFPDMDAWHQQVSVMWLFDDLIANIDRHLNNAMISPDHRLMLIDNSKTFRVQKTLLNDLNGAGTGTHARFWGEEYDAARQRWDTHYPRELIERLRTISKDDLKKALKKFVWGRNRGLVSDRLELILERIDSMGQAAYRRESAPPLAPPRSSH